MSYREAKSLKTLHAEVNAAAPNRSKASDGWIGDAAHATRDSDHNPWVKDIQGIGVVRARDFTHDPKGGLDCHVLAKHLAGLLGKHPALGEGAYVIWNRRIISTSRLDEGWRTYTGSNAHTKHLHVSVGLKKYDSTAPWGWPVTEEEDMSYEDWTKNGKEQFWKDFSKHVQRVELYGQASGVPPEGMRYLAPTLSGVRNLSESTARAVVEILDRVDDVPGEVVAELRAALDEAD